MPRRHNQGIALLTLGAGRRRHNSASSGTPAEPAITLAAPTYSDTFNSYADGYRLVAGDPNANAGQVATNPGNLGWSALLNGGGVAGNGRFNPIVYQGAIVKRTANTREGDNGLNEYLLSPPVTVAADHYIKAGLPPSSSSAHVALKGVDGANCLWLRNNNGNSLNLVRYNAGATSSVAGLASATTVRKMGGIHANFIPLTRSDESITAITYGTTAFIRRGPGFPLGVASGYTFTDPGGTRIGMLGDAAYLSQNKVDSIEAGAVNTVLLITETFKNWYPKIKASAGAAITTGSASITFTGTYLGTAPSRLQWALFDPETGTNVKDWAWVATASATIGGGNWSATVSVPCGLNGRKAYAIGFRVVGSDNIAQPGSAVVSVATFYVTLNIGLIGQSNASGLTDAMTSGTYVSFPGGANYTKANPPTLPPTSVSFGDQTVYYTQTTDTAGRANAVLGDMLSSALNIPVSIESLGMAGHGAVACGPAGADWAYVQAHHAYAGGAYEILYLSQGENEFVSGGSTWLSQWQTNLAEYRAQYMHGQPSGTVIPVFLAWTGRNADVPGSSSNSSAQAMRLGQDGFVAAVSDSYPCAHHVGLLHKAADLAHYVATPGAGYAEMNRRIGLSIKKWLADVHGIGSQNYNGMGPQITSVTRSGAVLTLPVTLNGAASTEARNGNDQSLTATASALTSWEVNSASDFTGTSYTVSSAALASNTVTLTLGTTPPGPVYVRNHYGFSPDITSWVFGAYADGTYIGSKPVITPLLSN